MVLPLASTADQQFAQLDRKVRNQVRKAQKSGISMTSGGLELLDAFYDVFATNMRDLGTPVYTKAFFREVLTAFPADARVFCANLENQTIAASIVLRDRDRMEVPWASAFAQFNSLAPNMLLYWEMLQTAVEQGCTHFDFGRCTPDAGTYRFKAQWGAVPHELCWEYWLANGQSLPNSESGQRALRDRHRGLAQAAGQRHEDRGPLGRQEYSLIVEDSTVCRRV